MLSYIYPNASSYLYVKKKNLCKKKNLNSTSNPNRILNLQGIATLELNNPITQPTNIMTTLSAPFYETYTIDPSEVLFGQAPTPCDGDTWKKYINYPTC